MPNKTPDTARRTRIAAMLIAQHQRNEARTLPERTQAEIFEMEKRPDIKALRDKGHSGRIYDVGEAVPGRRSIGSTKGQPFSRVRVVGFTKAKDGRPAQFTYQHNTRKTRRVVPATPEYVQALIGGNLPFAMVSELTGGLA